MKSLFPRTCLIVSLCGAILTAQQPVTNETILKLLKAGVGEETILAVVNQQPGNYSVADTDIPALKSAGVSEKIIAAMIGKSGTRNTQANGAPTPAGAAILPNPTPLILQDATPIRLRLNRNLSSADAQTGETVDFEVLDELVVDGFLLVPRGATAIATVTEAQAKRRMARGGKLDVNIDFVRLVNGDKVALRAVKEAKGGGHTGAMTGAIVATALVAWPAAPFFLLMHGRDITIPKGTEITAYVNGEIKLDRSKFGPGTATQPAVPTTRPTTVAASQPKS